ncbi:MAG: class I SAM-dependent methyltransferase [Planctomycetes bacterium]|nr:class I SAM-dependent methyltransferase [Planctomycetota bacterium]
MTAACPICTAPVRTLFKGRILGRYETAYHHCASCGLLRTDPPHWLNEAYGRPISSTDTGLVARNLACARVMTTILGLLGRPSEAFVDVAAGYGLFVRLMRDAGYDFCWDDPYATNIFAEGFGGDNVRSTSIITAFEVLEHIHDPCEFIERLRQRWSFQMMFFSTDTYSGQPPAIDAWRYYSVETGQHVCFYENRTLDQLAKRFGLRHTRLGFLHAFAPASTIPWYAPLACGPLSRIIAPLLSMGRSRVMTDHALQVRLLHDRQEHQDSPTDSLPQRGSNA